jgi:hypothetical protein
MHGLSRRKMTKYIVYERKEVDGRIVSGPIAGIEGTQVFGQEADRVKSMLTRAGWPDQQPDPIRILHGSRVWVEIVPE